MPRKAALGLTFIRFLMSINQANQWWFPLRNTGFHVTGIGVPWDKNIHAEEAKKTEAEAVLKKLLASGMSADEILEKLK